jgi:O-antigen ligase
MVLMFQQTAFVPRVKRYLTLLLIGAVLAGVAYQVPTVAARFQSESGFDAKTGEARARLYPVLWEMFLRSPFYGAGPDDYQAELTRRAMPHLWEKQKTITSHNLVLRLLVETGVVGFVIFMTAVMIALRAAWRARRGLCGLLPLAMLLPFVTVGSVFNDPTQNPAYWFAIAYALAGRN